MGNMNVSHPENNPTEPGDVSDLALERWLVKQLRNAPRPTGDELMAFYAGALSDDDSKRVREQIRISPQALRDYADVTGKTLAQIQQELAPEPSLIALMTGVVAGAFETVRRNALQIQNPSTAQTAGVFRGSGLPPLMFEVSGEPTATVLIEQAEAPMHRYQVTGIVMFDDAGRSARGEFQLSRQNVTERIGELSDTGAFDLGLLNSGEYRLEITIESQLIDLPAIKIGDAS